MLVESLGLGLREGEIGGSVSWSEVVVQNQYPMLFLLVAVYYVTVWMPKKEGRARQGPRGIYFVYPWCTMCEQEIFWLLYTI
jgi:hypothetical protein